MNLALSSGTPASIRTRDQRIRNPLIGALPAPVEALANANETSCARSDANARELASAQPVSALRASDYARLAELALAAGEWDLLSRVARDRALLDESRATQSGVTQLAIERRKRSGT